MYWTSNGVTEYVLKYVDKRDDIWDNSDKFLLLMFILANKFISCVVNITFLSPNIM